MKTKCVTEGFLLVCLMLTNGTLHADPLATSQTSTPSGAQLTEEKAIQRAVQFCKDVECGPASSSEVPITAPDARFSNSAGGTELSYRPKQWQVTLQKGGVRAAEVSVDDASGRVLSYKNYAARQSSRDIKDQKPPLARENAMERATKALVAADADILRELTFAQRDDPFYGAFLKDDEWYIPLQRVFHGMLYREQAALVRLDRTSGMFLSLYLNFSTLPPTSLFVKIPPEDALEHANRQIRNGTFSTDGLPRVTLELVQPNAFRKIGMGDSGTPTSLQSVVAWVVRYRIKDIMAWQELWLNASTGQIEGGTTDGIPTAPGQDYEKVLSVFVAEENIEKNIGSRMQGVQSALRSARSLEVRRAGNPAPLRVLDIKSSPIVFSILKEKTRFTTTVASVAGEPDVLLHLPETNQRVGYHSRLGLLTVLFPVRRGGHERNEWYVAGMAGDEFVRWIAKELGEKAPA